MSPQMGEHFPMHGKGPMELTKSQRELTDLALLTMLEQRDVLGMDGGYLEQAELEGYSDKDISEAFIRAAKEFREIDREMEGL